jgi:hypothetical protein
LYALFTTTIGVPLENPLPDNAFTIYSTSRPSIGGAWATPVQMNSLNGGMDIVSPTSITSDGCEMVVAIGNVAFGFVLATR